MSWGDFLKEKDKTYFVISVSETHEKETARSLEEES